MAHQRPATGCARANALRSRFSERDELIVDVRDDGQATVICRWRGRRQIQGGQLLLGVAAVEPADGEPRTVLKEHGVNALQPFGALVDERLAQPHQRAQLEDVLGRDPRLRQPPLHQQSRRWRA